VEGVREILVQFALADGARMAAKTPANITLTTVTRNAVFRQIGQRRLVSLYR